MSMKRILRVLLAMTLALGVMVGTAAADTLWYNGDFNGSGNSVSNRNHPYMDLGSGQYYLSYARVYDDFLVPAGGWTVDSVWSNNRFTSGVAVTGATWEIRSGVSAGNGGTLVQSGSVFPTLTNTGRGTGDYTEYQVLISGLTFHLDPGTYWLNVTPGINFAGDSYSSNSATSGLNAEGQPPGNNDYSYYNYFTHYGNGSEDVTYFKDVSDWYGPVDFSMGIAGVGSAVPLPASLPLLGSGLLGLLGWGYRRRK